MSVYMPRLPSCSTCTYIWPECLVCKARTICTKCIRLFCEDCSKIHAKHFSDHELYIVKFETIYDVYCLSHGDPLIMLCEACSSYICVVCRYLTCSTHDVELVSNMLNVD